MRVNGIGRLGEHGVIRPLLLGCLLLLGSVPLAYALLGDVDEDADIDDADARLVLDAVVGTSSLSSSQRLNADVDDTASVTVADAQLIRQFVEGQISEFPPRRPYTGGSIAINRAGTLVGVVNPDNDSVSFIDVGGDTVLEEVSVGRTPGGIAFSRNGLRVYVTNRAERSVSVIDTAGFEVVDTIAVGAEPYEIVINNRGDTAYVSNMMSATISVIDLAIGSVVDTVPVGDKPQGLAVSADSASIYVTHLNGGFVTHLDAETLSSSQIGLSDIAFDPNNLTEPAGVPNRMKSVAINPASGEVWLPHILSNSANTVAHVFNTTIFPAVSIIDAADNTELADERMTLFNGFPVAVSSPEALAFSPDGTLAYVVSSASNDLSIINTATRQQVGLLRDVGDNPRGIVVTPDGTKAYIFSRLSPQVPVIDLTTESVLTTLEPAANLMPPNIDNGRRVFFTAASEQTARERFFSCESCHFDGRDDGRTWFFANGPRQTQSMAGGSEFVGLLHHNGDRENWQDFAAAFTSLQGGTGLTADQLNDMADFGNNAIRMLDNPHLGDDYRFTDQALEGRRVFKQAGCAACHSGPFLTDADGHTDISDPLLHDVGTRAEGTGSQDQFDRTRDQASTAGGTVRPAGQFESTLLLGVHATAPYLHDGSAATLLETLNSTHNPGDQHGMTSTLSATERQQLVAYMRQLHITNARVTITFPVDNTPVTDLTRVRGRVLPGVEQVQIRLAGGEPISATVSNREFTATVAPEQVPALITGTRFTISAEATTADGEPGRNRIEAIANFGGSADPATSTVAVSPAVIGADGADTATVTVTPRDSAADPVGSGLTLEITSTLGEIGPVTDNGDGTYSATLTAGTTAGTATVSAAEQGGSSFSQTASLRLSAGEVDTEASQINLAVNSLEADGVGTVTVTVTPRDAFGNVLAPGQSVSGSVDLGSLGAFVDQNDGTYQAAYTAATDQGTATLNVTVNGTPLTLEPQLSLIPDVTAPPPADPGAISFASVVDGVSQVTGGAGAVEPLASVRLENLATGQVVFATANANGAFTAAIGVEPNQAVSIRVEDVAGNVAEAVETTPFVLEVNAVRGIVQSAQPGGGFAPVSGETVSLQVVDLSAIPSISFTPLSIDPAVTDSEGRFEIILPDNFVPDPDLAVVSAGEYVLINDTERDVLVDELGTAVVNMIANNDFFLFNPDPLPASNFTAGERLAIESTLRTALGDQDIGGLDPNSVLSVIDADIFSDADPDPDDQVAKATFADAAETPGETAPPTTINGTLTVPGAGGAEPLAGVRVDLGTLRFTTECGGQFCIDNVAGIHATTDAQGEYSLVVPGYLSPGSRTVMIAAGDLTYDGGGAPGPFTENLSILSLGGFFTRRDTPQVDIDVAGMAAIGLISNDGAPIENFSPDEMDQLLALLRDTIAGFDIPLAGRSLQQVYLDIFNALLAEPAVTDLVEAISDVEGTNLTTVEVNPASLEADGYSTAAVTVHPRNELAEPLGPGRVIELSTDRGTITSPAVDEGDGFYTATLIAPTTPGTATVKASLEGSVFDDQPEVEFTPDTTAPAAPDTGEIIFINVGGGTATVIGLPGAAEPGSTLELVNAATGLTINVAVNADGSFRVDIPATAGDPLNLHSRDVAGNDGATADITVDTGLTLPGIANPDAVPDGVAPSLSRLGQSGFGSVPAGYSYLGGVTLDLEGQTAASPLSVLANATAPVNSGTPILLVQAIESEQSPALRVLGPAIAAGGVLQPEPGTAFPGITEGGRYAYLAAPTEPAYAFGTVTGGQSQPVEGVKIELPNSPFIDLTRDNGHYLIAGTVNSAATIRARLLPHTDPVERGIQLPHADSRTRRDFTIDTRADISHGFTARFAASDGRIARQLYVTPGGEHLHLVVNTPGDLFLVDTESMTEHTLLDDFASMTDLALAPNGQIGMVSYFNKVRNLRVDIEDFGTQIDDIGFPRTVAITPNGELALVASSLDNLNTDTDADALFFVSALAPHRIEAGIDMPSDPHAIAVNESGTRAYVVSRTQATLTVVDIVNRSVIETIFVGSEPIDVRVDHSGAELYIADFTDDVVRVLDATLVEDGVPGNELLAEITTGARPDALALTPNSNTLLVAERADDTVSVIDTLARTVTEVWAATDIPLDLAVAPTGTKAYVLDADGRRGALEVPLAEQDTTNPRIVDVGPQDRPQVLLQDSPIEIVFNEPMDPATLNQANIELLDETATPLSGTLTLRSDRVSAVFTPDQRYLLNSQITVNLANTLTDKAGNALAPVSRTVPTQPMQLPDLSLIDIDLTEQGIIATGRPGAVEPNSVVEIKNLTTGRVFRLPNDNEGNPGTAGDDGSFQLTLQGLDNDGYELVTQLFGGRAATDPVPLPVNFTITIPRPDLISYTPGPQGTLNATGAAGAVDPKTTRLRIINHTKEEVYETETVNADGSFQLPVFVQQGDQLSIVTTILQSITLDPVTLNVPDRAPPVIDYITPSRFTFGNAVEITVVGEGFGTRPGDLLLKAGDQTQTDFVLDDVAGSDQQGIVFDLPAGTDSGRITVTYAGQQSNSIRYVADLPPNTDPFAETVVESDVAGEPLNILGGWNGQYVDLGEGGSILVELGFTAVDQRGPDLRIGEDGSDGPDCYEVQVGASAGGPFESLGQYCGFASVELGEQRLVRFVRIIDADDGEGNAAAIGNIQVLNTKVALKIEEVDASGNVLRSLGEPSPAAMSDAGDIIGPAQLTISPSQGDFPVCKGDTNTRNIRVTVTPAPQRGAYYGPRCKDNWTVTSNQQGRIDGGTSTSGSFTFAYTPPSSGGGFQETLDIVVNRVDDGGSDPCPTDSGSGNIKVDVVELTIDKPTGDPVAAPTADNEFTFDPSITGVLTVPMKASFSPNSADISQLLDDIVFSIDPVGSSSLAWVPANGGKPALNGNSLEVKAEFTGLPASNSSFGTKGVELKCGPGASEDTEIEVFYMKLEKNHPGANKGVTPNWYYYWSQTSANNATTTMVYGPTCGRSNYDYFAGRQINLCSTAAFTQIAAWGSPQGIDTFAWVTAHEGKHHTQTVGFWPLNWVRSRDSDLDWLPNGDEPTYMPGRPYDPNNSATYQDTIGYGTNPIPDIEDICMRSQSGSYGLDNLWTNGNADDEDWADPGKNSRNFY